MIKAVNKAATSKAHYKNCHSGAKGTVCRYAPSKRQRGGLHDLLARQLTVPDGRWLYLPSWRPSLPWTKTMDGNTVRCHVVALPRLGFGGRGPGQLYKGGVYDQGEDSDSKTSPPATQKEERETFDVVPP